MNSNKILTSLIKEFSRLPSLGPKSAKRVVLHLLNNKETTMSNLLLKLSEAYDNIKKCPICGNWTTENICEICSNVNRDKNTLCIVETVADLWAIENTLFYNGLYHILGGHLSAIENITPSDLNINSIEIRIKENPQIKEIIIATNPTLEGQTTAFYVADILKKFNIKVTQPAYGIPLGSEFDYLDDSTLEVAFKNKKDFNN